MAHHAEESILVLASRMLTRPRLLWNVHLEMDCLNCQALLSVAYKIYKCLLMLDRGFVIGSAIERFVFKARTNLSLKRFFEINNKHRQPHGFVKVHLLC